MLKLVITLRILSDLIDYRKRASKFRTDLKCVDPCNLKVDLGPKVSIIVPTLNEADTLPKLLHSISSQTYSNIEVVVVDAASQDDTVSVAEKLGAKVIRVSKKSVGYQSDIGAKASSGQIIVRCDADTIFARHHIEQVVRVLSQSTAKVFHCGHWFYDGTFLDNFMAFLYDKYWRRLDKTSGAMTAIKREAYIDIGGYDETMVRGEDFDLGRRILAKYGPQGIIYDYKLLATAISARAIRKHGRLRYYLKLGQSFF